jgi:hypothetical protein
MKHMRVLRGAAVLLLGAGLTLLVGCHFDPFTSEYLTSDPPQSELIGEWVFCEASPEVPDGFGRSASFLLFSDGRFEFQNPCRVYGPWLWGNEESGHGEWRLTQRQDRYCCLELHFHTLRGEPVDLSDFVFLRRVSGEIVLHFTFGDPDDGNFVLFKNAARNKNATTKR